MTQLGLILGLSWEPPKPKNAIRIKVFLMFLLIHVTLLKMPNMSPRGPQERLKRLQEEPKGGPQGPKRHPRRPQDDPKTALRRLQDGPSRAPEPP